MFAAVPAADHHTHLVGPIAAEVLTPTPLPMLEEELPDGLEALLDRRALRRPATIDLVTGLYTAEAVVHSQRGSSWVSGPVSIARALNDLPPGFDLAPVAYVLDGDGGFVAGHFVRGNARATFHFSLRREGGEWRIASDAHRRRRSGVLSVSLAIGADNASLQRYAVGSIR